MTTTDAEETPARSWPMAHEVTLYYGTTQEDVRWIGKPWRRIELLINRSFYKGECVEQSWTASWSLGLRRLGWHFHFAITRDRVQDYGDERQ